MRKLPGWCHAMAGPLCAALATWLGEKSQDMSRCGCLDQLVQQVGTGRLGR